MEKIIETKICKHCNCQFGITDIDMEFYDKVSPVFYGKKYSIPAPTLCPDCRQQRRLSFRNERKLYKRKCDATGREIISMYSPDKPYKVYDQKEWWSDRWDAMNYGKDFDFNKGFFEQFKELSISFPRFALNIFESENCDYNNFLGKSKNCYYSFASGIIENVYYTYWSGWSNNLYDCYNIIKSENLYYSIDCINSFNSMYLFWCESCSFSTYLKDCVGCVDCIGCIGLKNKQYYIGNKKYSKEEYFIEKGKLSIKEIKNIYDKTYKNTFFRNFSVFNSENCVGEYIKNSKNLINGYICELCNDSKNIIWGFELNDSIDSGFYNNSNKNLEVISGGFGNNILFCNFPFESRDLIYCDNCFYSSNLFGCVGLKNKQYCILNKQYKKEEYEKLVPKIIEHMMKTGEWGEFFPSSISPFGYNETVAQEYYPIPHPDPLLRGEGERFNWSYYESPFPKVEKIIPASKLPDNIADIPDDILNWAIECEVTKKPFRIIKQELEFYRKHNLPIPRRHPDQRHLDRMALRNPRKLFDRKCDKCGKEIKTTYSPDRKEIVYCEECYNREF